MLDTRSVLRPRSPKPCNRPSTSHGACTASRARAWSSVKSSSALVGKLEPARPSATRAGVSPRKRSGVIGAPDLVRSFGRDGGLAQPHGIIRCVLPATRSSAGEHDQVMRNHDRGNQVLDLAADKTPQREFPELDLVIAENADLPEYVSQHN